MDSDWEKFVLHLNQILDTKLTPVEHELNSQDELIKKLSQSLSKISESIQLKYGKLSNSSLSLPTEKPEPLENPEVLKIESQETLDQ